MHNLLSEIFYSLEWRLSVLSGLLASAREIRNPITVGISALVTFWVLAGDEVVTAARSDPFGARLLVQASSMPDGAKLAALVFVAAMTGSLMWNLAVSRMVRYISRRAGHPDWHSMIEEAQEAVKRYEEYDVTTYKSPGPGSKPSSFDVRHRVPSARHAATLQERVDERERRSAEMSFRVTLALSLIPLTMSIGLEGGGLWWLSVGILPLAWLDVALLKHTTLRTVRRFSMQDVTSRREEAERQLGFLQQRASEPSQVGETYVDQETADRQQQLRQKQQAVDDLKAEEQRLRSEETRPSSRLFAFLEGHESEYKSPYS